MRMTSIRSVVLPGALVLALAACSKDSGSKAAAAPDTAQQAEQAPPSETPASETPASETTPSEEPTPTLVEARVVFDNTDYIGDAGVAFAVVATSYDKFGQAVPTDMLHYRVDADSVASFVTPQTGRACKDYTPAERRPTKVANTATQVWLCGLLKGTQTKIRAESFNTHGTGESSISIH
jgi:hypothetical protein